MLMLANKLTIDESSSNLVTEKSNDTEFLEEFEITDHVINDETSLEVIDNLPEQTLGKLSISSLEEQEIVNLGPTEEGLATLSELEVMLEENEIETNVESETEKVRGIISIISLSFLVIILISIFIKSKYRK